MVSTQPPVAQSGNSTHLLDESGPMRQALLTTHSDPSPLGPVPRSQISLDILRLTQEWTLDDINNMWNHRNELRTG